MQEAILHAAATALQLAADGRITARGTLGSALQLPGHQHVYDGDRPAPYQSVWQEAVAEVEAAITLARTDRDTAGQLLALLTIGCRNTRPVREGTRLSLRHRHPARFLPSARELGDADLAWPCSTSMEVERATRPPLRTLNLLSAVPQPGLLSFMAADYRRHLAAHGHAR